MTLAKLSLLSFAIASTALAQDSRGKLVGGAMRGSADKVLGGW